MTDNQPRYTTKRLHDEIAKAKAQARHEALQEAAGIAYRTCAETRHVTLGDKAREAILGLMSDPAPVSREMPEILPGPSDQSDRTGKRDRQRLQSAFKKGVKEGRRIERKAYRPVLRPLLAKSRSRTASMTSLLRAIRKDQLNFVDYIGGGLTIHFLIMGNGSAALITIVCEFFVNVALGMAGYKREGDQ